MTCNEPDKHHRTCNCALGANIAINGPEEEVVTYDRCPKCGQDSLHHGYGLTGGGIGGYTMCFNDDCDYFDKVQDPEGA